MTDGRSANIQGVIPDCDRGIRSLPHLSGPEGPPDGNSMGRAEGVARITHDADIAVFRGNPVSLDPDKNAHGTHVNAVEVVLAMVGSFTQIGIDIHLDSYIYGGPNFHGYPLPLKMSGICTIPHPLSFLVVFNFLLFIDSVFIASPRTHFCGREGGGRS